MDGQARDVFLEVSRGLNDGIREVERALAQGTVPAALVERLRAQVREGLSQLGPVAAAYASPNVAKVAGHLDLLLTLMDSLNAAPALSRKLLAHLLEEQMEITAQESRPVPAPPTPPASGPAAAASELPGGRRPLTVGSLFGR